MAAEPNVVKEAIPTQAGTMSAFRPQWRHSREWGKALNERVGFKGGADWTDVPVTIIRGGVIAELPNGQEVRWGIPFPHIGAGVLETIYMFGYEQAQALAWSWAASAESCGATVEVRVKHFRLPTT
jgi:hypothetical protein